MLDIVSLAVEAHRRVRDWPRASQGWGFHIKATFMGFQAHAFGIAAMMLVGAATGAAVHRSRNRAPGTDRRIPWL